MFFTELNYLYYFWSYIVMKCYSRDETYCILVKFGLFLKKAMLLQLKWMKHNHHETNISNDTQNPFPYHSSDKNEKFRLWRLTWLIILGLVHHFQIDLQLPFEFITRFGGQFSQVVNRLLELLQRRIFISFQVIQAGFVALNLCGKEK